MCRCRSTVIVPVSGRRTVATSRSSVVLPLPLVPTTAVTPGPNVSSAMDEVEPPAESQGDAVEVGDRGHRSSNRSR